MSRMSALGDLLGSVLERGARLVDWSSNDDALGTLEQLAAALMSAKGEASGIALASRFVSGYAALEPDRHLAFFRHLGAAFDPDPEEARAAAEAHAAEPTSASLRALFQAVEPPRQELFRRLNQAPGGTEALVAMRADLLRLVREHPELDRIETDFRHLLASWFNRGFLVMRPIDWQSPAAMLEKIIAYEAVHQIDNWDELRRRVEPRVLIAGLDLLVGLEQLRMLLHFDGVVRQQRQAGVVSRTQVTRVQHTVQVADGRKRLTQTIVVLLQHLEKACPAPVRPLDQGGDGLPVVPEPVLDGGHDVFRANGVEGWQWMLLQQRIRHGKPQSVRRN